MKTLKITLSMVSFLFIMLFLNSCNKEEILPEQLEPATIASPVVPLNPQDEKMRDHLVEAYGFGPDEIQVLPNEMIAHGDIVFPKDSFWELYALPEGSSYKHFRSTYLVTAVTTIYVRFDANVPSSWKTAYINAISKWNSLNGKVRFSYCPYNTYNFANPSSICALFTGVRVKYEDLGNPNTFANAQLPTSDGRPGAISRINSGFTGTPLTTAQKLKTAVHELGHTIGIKHTDSGDGTLISTANSTCNTNTDPNSIMNQGYMSFVSFSTCDIAAFRKLYP